MGMIARPDCGMQVNADAAGCQNCGAEPKTGVVPEWGEKMFVPPTSTPVTPPPPAARTRDGLLSQYRADPEGAATQAYHPAGYVWTFDRKLDRERCFRWRADPCDAFERGLPVDEEDRRDMLAHETEASAAPETGWRHFRFCECRPCNPPRVEPKDHSTLETFIDVCITGIGMGAG